MNTKTLFNFLKDRKLYYCEECFNTGTHNNKYLRLQIDHINGINEDNRLENLRFLCPNCHSQSDTFTGKNAKTRNINRPSTEEFKKLYDEYSLKEISLIKAVSYRTVYNWFKFFTKEENKNASQFTKRLTCEQVMEIINSKESARKLGKIYNYSKTSILNIKNRNLYKNCHCT